MPPASVLEVLVQLGLMASVLVFLIVLVIFCVLMIAGEIAFLGKKLCVFFLIRQQNK